MIMHISPTGRRLAHLLVLLGLLALTVSTGICAADTSGWPSGKYMMQAVNTVTGAVRKLSDSTDYGYDTNSNYCVLGAYLQKEKSVSLIRELEGGVTYLFVGGGDDDAVDVDIFVKDMDGKTLASDDKDDNAPVVRYTPKKTVKVSLDMALYSSRAKGNSGSFCVMAILRKGGYDVPVNNLDTAMAQIVAASQVIREKLGKVTFHDEPNQWSLLGVILPSESSSSITGMTFEKGNHFFIAAGDSHANDIDLYLLNGDEETVESDEEDDATPLFLYETEARADYGFKIECVDADDDALVIGAILDVEKK